MSQTISFQPQAVQGCANSNANSNINQWDSEVFDCCQDMGICLCGTFLPMCLACKVAQDYGECCCLPFLSGTVIAMRTGIRERYHIPVISIFSLWNILRCYHIRIVFLVLPNPHISFASSSCLFARYELDKRTSTGEDGQSFRFYICL
ncbi:hypothetical protein XELAEV_18035979mg [Xenopus laevis]|uniref:Uncharacterized protein n=1 Tax=Xenopus laevis TaxID=8355 RepID=A0A974CGJ6_XENLA|nr:hypothetical protein XELAEV_18035979mg [Xenopus laevis]